MMNRAWTEDDLLALSGVQHYVFCPRQWALIHLEQQWNENEHTVEGAYVHERCHDSSIKEKRGSMLIVRGLQVVSRKLGLSGVCDVIEFYECDDGVKLAGEDARYRPVPVEYKRGKRKTGNEDRVQVCAQAIALEEMFGIQIPIAYLYYDAERRREEICLSGSLRAMTEKAAYEMHKCFNRRYTPRPKKTRRCTSCSLASVCEPVLADAVSVETYIHKALASVVE